MENTSNLKLPLLVPNQSSKEITHNEALIIIDSLLNNGAINKNLISPPENPNINDLYIIANNAIGLWENKDNQITFYNNGWKFVEPKIGSIFWINNENCLNVFNGENWTTISKSSYLLNDLDNVDVNLLNSDDILKYNGENFVNTKEVQNISLLGINTSADTNNKLSVKSDNVLFDNNGSSSMVKINKLNTLDTASHLFQTNYNGKAEFGLIGEENFSLKVSNDGSNWNESFKVDNSSGKVDFKNNITIKNNKLSKFAMPGDSAINISLGPSGSHYTVPADGYLILYGISSAAKNRCELNNPSKFCTTSISGEAGESVMCTSPCKKGDTVYYSYNFNLTTFLFVAAFGEQY